LTTDAEDISGTEASGKLSLKRPTAQPDIAGRGFSRKRLPKELARVGETWGVYSLGMFQRENPK
jgi:hypothetical protein